jgi:N-acetylglutamate synthase-like GNAT family acetyltransferase
LLRTYLLRAGRCLNRETGVVEIREAANAEMAVIYALLEQAGLPTSDIPASNPRFMVLREHGNIVAVGGLQPFGSAALVRSVVVSAGRRGAGLGRVIVEELEKAARAARIDRLILLTQTAREFFAHQGFHVIERSAAPQEVQGSEEFRSLCPASATCMMKVLAEHAQE